MVASRKAESAGSDHLSSPTLGLLQRQKQPITGTEKSNGILAVHVWIGLRDKNYHTVDNGVTRIAVHVEIRACPVPDVQAAMMLELRTYFHSISILCLQEISPFTQAVLKWQKDHARSDSHWKRATKLLTFTAESTASAVASVAHNVVGALHAHMQCTRMGGCI